MQNHYVDESELCLISRLKSFEVRTIWIQMDRAYLVMWTVLCFQFHTHWSLQHSRASHYFQTVAELCISVHNLCPSKPRPFAQIKIDMSVHVQIFTAQRYTFGNWDFNQSFFSFFSSLFLFEDKLHFPVKAQFVRDFEQCPYKIWVFGISLCNSNYNHIAAVWVTRGTAYGQS